MTIIYQNEIKYLQVENDRLFVRRKEFLPNLLIKGKIELRKKRRKNKETLF